MLYITYSPGLIILHPSNVLYITYSPALVILHPSNVLYITYSPALVILHPSNVLYITYGPALVILQPSNVLYITYSPALVILHPSNVLYITYSPALVILHPSNVLYITYSPALVILHPSNVLYITYSPALVILHPFNVLYITYSPLPHGVDGLSLNSGYVVASSQHCVDGVPAIEALHISDGHIVTLHADGPLEKSGRVMGEEGGGRRQRHFRSDKINTVSDTRTVLAETMEGRDGERKEFTIHCCIGQLEQQNCT